jgi:hypothetical protein
MLAGYDMLFIGSQQDLPFTPYFYDKVELVANSFRVVRYPTVVVLSNRQEVLRQVEVIDTEVIAATIEALDRGAMIPPWQLAVGVGQRVTGDYEDFTGLVVYWRSDCEGCKSESTQLETLRETGVLVEIVGVEPGAPEVAQEEGRSSTADAWGLPAAPMHIYLKDGTPLWIDAGYRDDLVEMVRTVVELIDE